MRVRVSMLSYGLGLAAISLTGMLWSAAHGADQKRRGQPIEFFEPKSSEVLTNLNQLNTHRNTPQQLQEELYQPIDGLGTKSSLTGMRPPAAQPSAPPIIQSRRVKELLERRNEWPFMRPEDLAANPSTEDILKVPEYGPDGVEKTKQSALERFYGNPANQERRRSDNSNDLFFSDDAPTKAAKRDEVADDDSSLDDSRLPGRLRDSTQTLKRLFDTDSKNDFANHNPFSDVFGLGENSLTKEQLTAHKQVLKEFQQLLDSSSSSAAVPQDSLGRVTDSLRPAGLGTVNSPFNSPFALPRQDGGKLPDLLNPNLSGPTVLDPNAQALGQWNRAALPTTPTVRAPTVSTIMDFPRRKF